MKIEIGKFYRNRVGDIVLCFKTDQYKNGDDICQFMWVEHPGGGGRYFVSEEGRIQQNTDLPYNDLEGDLIEEVVHTTGLEPS